MPEISVIVPVYNVEQYIGHCIDSILNQSYSNFEVLLINDGSSDNSGTICDNYAAIDERITVFHKQNGGVSSARNKGVEQARGKYIVFVDSDDIIHKKKLEILHHEVEKHSADVAYCGYQVFSSELNTMEKTEIPYHSEVMDVSEFWRKWSSAESAECISLWGKIYQKSVFDGVIFPEGKIHEDVYVFHKWVDRCNTIVHVDAKLYYYRKRENSIMTSAFSINNLDVIEALVERADYFLDNSNSEMADRMMIDAMGRMVSAEYLKSDSKDATERYAQLRELCISQAQKNIRFRKNLKFVILAEAFKMGNLMYKTIVRVGSL